ncbi:MAG TPA: helix-turn-helix domain-containing protein [Clostridiaceae bacterium]|nr:helix-turn-helix domain-containing protein [Clostridiaceae bacterium]
MIVVKNPQKLKEDLTSNGNTITSVAKKLRYSKAYISSIVTGIRNPNEKVSIGICELLQKQFDDYFFIQTVHKKVTK